MMYLNKMQSSYWKRVNVSVEKAKGDSFRETISTEKVQASYEFP